MSDNGALNDTIERLIDAAEGDKVKFGKVVEALGSRGFGPLLLALSAFLVLPTGAIPGIPAVIGLALLLTMGQLIIGRKSPWVPDWLGNFKIKAETLRNSGEKAKPWARRLGRLLSPRLSFLANERVIGAVSVISSLMVIGLGFVPLLPMVFGVNLMLLGMGLVARDGLVAMLGYLVSIGGLILAIMQFRGS